MYMCSATGFRPGTTMPLVPAIPVPARTKVVVTAGSQGSWSCPCETDPNRGKDFVQVIDLRISENI